MKKTTFTTFVLFLLIPFICSATTPPACPPPPPSLGNVSLTGVVSNAAHATASSVGTGEALSTNSATANLNMVQTVGVPSITGGFAPTMNLTVETGASGASLTTQSGNGASVGSTLAHASGLVTGSVDPKVAGVGSLPMNGGVNGISDISTKAVNAQDANAAAGTKATLVASGVISLVDGTKTIAVTDTKTAIAQVNNTGIGLTNSSAGANSLFSTKPISIGLLK